MPRFSSLAVAAALAVGSSEAAHTCPAAFTYSSYAPGVTVSVNNPASTTLDEVYQCREAPLNLFCGQTGYEPGTSQYWEHAWMKTGECVPGNGQAVNSAPTPTNVCVAIPQAQLQHGLWATTDQHCGVCTSGLVTWWPCNAGLCRCTDDAPSSGNAVASPVPQQGDVPVPLNLGACPTPYSPGVPGQGDIVSNNGVVYQCKTSVSGLHCPQAGYEPAWPTPTT